MGNRAGSARFVANGGWRLRASMRTLTAEQRRALLARLGGREGDVLTVWGRHLPRWLAAPMLRIRDRIDDDRRCYDRRLPIIKED